jgi:amino acid transporter
MSKKSSLLYKKSYFAADFTGLSEKEVCLTLKHPTMSLFHNLFRKKTIQDVLTNSAADASHGSGLHKNLTVIDLTALGIAAIIGTGVLSTIGKAIYFGGPSVVWLYFFTAVACGFSALCYAQFASTVPISGSAYTYSYITFGELLAWLVGWNLLMEYAIGNIAVAISWSDYFTGLMEGIGWKIPAHWTMDYLTASRMAADPDNASATALEAWNNAPRIGNLRLIADIPALTMTLLITALVYVGIRESKITGNIMVAIKLAIVLAVILIGAFYVNPENWEPFSPNGVSGVMRGMAAVFFAYIGFDALSTMAEECRDPRRDLPRSMFWSLLICTILYVAVVLVLTGLTSYKNFATENGAGGLDVKGDPLAFAFEQNGLHMFSGIIAFSAVIAIAAVFMVFQLGQPRIWMTMSRDGLLPERFGRIHPRFKTPAFATVVTGLVVAIPALFLNLTEVTDLASIGTLFAFAMVCGGVIVMDVRGQSVQAKYRVRYFNARYWLPVALLLIVGLIYLFDKDGVSKLFHCPESGCHDLYPFYAFLVGLALLSALAIYYQWSFVPVMGLILNVFMMSQLGWTNWVRFIVWIAVGLGIYFIYGYKNSKLGER